MIRSDRVYRTRANVISRPNYMDERPLLVLLHDPPEVLASPDPRTGKVELHNTWLVRNLDTVYPAQQR